MAADWLTCAVPASHGISNAEDMAGEMMEETCLPEAYVNCNPSPGNPSLPPVLLPCSLGPTLIPAQAPWEGPPLPSPL